MSQWRREASERLPELQLIIASKLVHSPMMLWIELNQEFERRCAMSHHHWIFSGVFGVTANGAWLTEVLMFGQQQHWDFASI